MLHDGNLRNDTGYLGEILGLGSRQESMKRAIRPGVIWCLYLAGAVWGSYAEDRWRLWSLAFPLGVPAIAIATDLWRPINAVEQKSADPGRDEPS